MHSSAASHSNTGVKAMAGFMLAIAFLLQACSASMVDQIKDDIVSKQYADAVQKANFEIGRKKNNPQLHYLRAFALSEQALSKRPHERKLLYDQAMKDTKIAQAIFEKNGRNNELADLRALTDAMWAQEYNLGVRSISGRNASLTRAITHGTNALIIYPENRQTHELLSDVYRMTEEYEKSLHHYKLFLGDAINQGNLSIEQLKVMAILSQKTGDDANSAIYYRQITEKAPQDSDFIVGNINSLLATGQYQDAIKEMDRMPALTPEMETQKQLTVGVSWYAVGKMEITAMMEKLKAIKPHPDYQKILNNQTFLDSLMLKEMEARSAFDRAEFQVLGMQKADSANVAHQDNLLLLYQNTGVLYYHLTAHMPRAYLKQEWYAQYVDRLGKAEKIYDERKKKRNLTRNETLNLLQIYILLDKQADAEDIYRRVRI